MLVSFLSRNVDVREWSVNLSPTFLSSLTNIVLYGSSKPLIYGIGNVLFFGSISYLFLFSWKKIAGFMQAQSWPFLLFFISNATLLFMDAEGRHLVFFYPWVLFVLFSSCSDDLDLFPTREIVIVNIAAMFHWMFFPLAEPMLTGTPELFLVSLGAGLTMKAYFVSLILVAILGLWWWRRICAIR